MEHFGLRQIERHHSVFEDQGIGGAIQEVFQRLVQGLRRSWSHGITNDSRWSLTDDHRRKFRESAVG